MKITQRSEIIYELDFYCAVSAHWIASFFIIIHPDCCCSRIKKKYLSNYPTLCMHNKNISKRCFDFIKWFHLNYGQIRNWFCMILMFFFGFAFGMCMIFDIPCLMFWFIKTTHLEKKRRHKILMWVEAKRMRSNRQSQRKIEQAVHYQWIGTILRPCLYYVALHQLDY